MAAKKLNLPLIKREQVVPGVHAYHFDRSPFLFTFKPGQYLKMRLPHLNPDEKGISRDFSIASSPTNQQEVVVMTKDGPSSFKQMLMGLPLNIEVEFRAPFGSFVLPETVSKPQVFLTGGIGITPFISMTQYWVDKQLHFPITLIASYSTAEEIILKSQFEKLAKEQSQFEYIPTVTKPEQSPDWKGQTGRIDQQLLEKYIPNLKNCTYYIVGPEGMTHTLYELLGIIGISEDDIVMEDFFGY